ncbi:MAG: hypothetical protein Q9O24_03870 [Gammaproteobacteria bacterium]|nr:hypothetical protein [Gammaproteobacteria bacterium]
MSHPTQTVQQAQLPNTVLENIRPDHENILSDSYQQIWDETEKKAVALMAKTWVTFSREHLLYDDRIQALWSYDSSEETLFHSNNPLQTEMI